MRQDKQDRFIVIIILILIAIFLIVYLLVNYLGRIEHRPQIPTGNVDIFEITFGRNDNICNCNCNCGCHNNGSMVGCENCLGNSISDNNTDGKVVVYDKDTEFSSNTPLNIFKQTAYYIVEDKIAPTSENSYHFVIRNQNNFNIKYSLETVETNIYNINMKFRLKRNGKYVLGNDTQYVTADEIKQYDVLLDENTYDVYTLDWKWFESSNDTQVGNQIEANYKLDLKVRANQYYKEEL